MIPRLRFPQAHGFTRKTEELSGVQGYLAIPEGTCDQRGLRPIADFFTCRVAAGGLDLLDAGFSITFDQEEGCHYRGLGRSRPPGHPLHRICIAAPSSSPPATAQAAQATPTTTAEVASTKS